VCCSNCTQIDSRIAFSCRITSHHWRTLPRCGTRPVEEAAPVQSERARQHAQRHHEHGGPRTAGSREHTEKYSPKKWRHSLRRRRRSGCAVRPRKEPGSSSNASPSPSSTCHAQTKPQQARELKRTHDAGQCTTKRTQRALFLTWCPWRPPVSSHTRKFIAMSSQCAAWRSTYARSRACCKERNHTTNAREHGDEHA
jgi:hypothetical protein